MATILVVDDYAPGREYVATLLSYQQHVVLQAADGVQGLALARAHVPHLIITDLIMPEMTGYEFAHHIRADPHLTATHLIFYTGSEIIGEVRRLAEACGVSVILSKPAEPEVLLAAVSDLLQAPPASPLPPPPDEFHREHLLLLTNTLADKVERLEAEIRERNRAEAQLRLQSAALDAAANAIMITNETGRIEWVNPAFERLTGYSSAEAIGQPARLLNSGRQPASYYAQMWAAILSGANWHGELINRRKDGSTYIQEQTITPVRDDHGVIRHFVAIQQDITQRKLIEAQLRDQAKLIESVGDAVISMDEHSVVRTWNRAAETMLGYSAAEALGHQVTTLLSYQPVQPVEPEALEQARATGSWSGEVNIRHKDGQVITTLIASSAMTDATGKLDGYAAVLHDITARRRAEADLAASEQRFRGLIENAPDGISILDSTGRIIYTSPAAQRILGYSPNEISSLDPAAITHPDDLPALLETVQTVTTQPGSSAICLYRLRHQNGAWRWIESVISNQPIGSQENAVIVNFRDITDRRQHERELEAVAQVSAALRQASRRDEILPLVLDQVMSLLDSAGAWVALVNPDNAGATVNVGHGLGAGFVGIQLEPGAGLTGHVIATGESFVTDDAPAETRMIRRELLTEARAAACLPLSVRGETIGAMWVARVTPFDSGEVRILTALADIVASALQRTALFEQTVQGLQRLTALRTIDQAITGSLDVRLTLNIVLDHVLRLLAADAADILLLDPHSQFLTYAAGRGFRHPGIEHRQPRMGEGLAGQVALTRQPLHVSRLQQSAHAVTRAAAFRAEGFTAYSGVPLVAKGAVVGVLEVLDRGSVIRDAPWHEFLEALAGQAAIAIDSARLFSDLQLSNAQLIVAYDTTIEGWSRALDLRDQETEGHTQRVTEMTLTLARAAGLPEAELVHVRRGALLHDMGKIGVPDDILRKPGPLTDEEWHIMRRHPALAYEMLSPISYLRPALDIPYCHHEKWDGTGYPRGLKGEEIPLAARLFAVVDVWDALRSNRPYRRGWEESRVIEYIQQHAGTHFDPMVVTIFLEILARP